MTPSRIEQKRTKQYSADGQPEYRALCAPVFCLTCCVNCFANGAKSARSMFCLNVRIIVTDNNGLAGFYNYGTYNTAVLRSCVSVFLPCGTLSFLPAPQPPKYLFSVSQPAQPCGQSSVLSGHVLVGIWCGARLYDNPQQ